MRRLTILFALCAAAILALSPAALAQQTSDLDCSQLGTSGASPEAVQAEAQAILDADASDPNGFDADGDGIACEFEASSTGEVSFEDGTGFTTDTAAAPAPQGDDLNCEDFGSREEAQAVLDADASDPNGLDADGDGLACNEVISAPPTLADEPSAQYQTPQSPSVEVAPVTPPPGADSPVFQSTEPDVAETEAPTSPAPVPTTPVSSSPIPESPASSSPVSAPTVSSSPRSDVVDTPAPVSPAPRPSSTMSQLPATGGDFPMPALTTGVVLLLGLGGLLTARRGRA